MVIMKTIQIIVAVASVASLGSFAYGAPVLEGSLREFALEVGQPGLPDNILPTSVPPVPQALEAGSPQGLAPGVRDEDLAQTLRMIKLMTDAHARNQAIEKCFTANEDRLTWQQVAMLLRAVSPTDHDTYHTYDRGNSIKSIVKQYLRRQAPTLSPDVAVSLAQRNTDSHDTNEMIEMYFRDNKHRLAQADVETLLTGIRSTDYDTYHTYDKESTTQRIIKAWGCPLCKS